jgi:hypothetical protein
VTREWLVSDRPHLILLQYAIVAYLARLSREIQSRSCDFGQTQPTEFAHANVAELAKLTPIIEIVADDVQWTQVMGAAYSH